MVWVSQDRSWDWVCLSAHCSRNMKYVVGQRTSQLWRIKNQERVSKRFIAKNGFWEGGFFVSLKPTFDVYLSSLTRWPILFFAHDEDQRKSWGLKKQGLVTFEPAACGEPRDRHFVGWLTVIPDKNTFRPLRLAAEKESDFLVVYGDKSLDYLKVCGCSCFTMKWHSAIDLECQQNHITWRHQHYLFFTLYFELASLHRRRL